MMINYSKYLDYINEAKNYDTAENFLGAVGFDAGVTKSADNWAKTISIIYAVAHKDLLAVVGGSRQGAAFAAEHKLPDRTVRSWLSGERQPPEYLIALLGYAVIGDIPDIDDYSEAKYE